MQPLLKKQCLLGGSLGEDGVFIDFKLDLADLWPKAETSWQKLCKTQLQALKNRSSRGSLTRPRSGSLGRSSGGRG